MNIIDHRSETLQPGVVNGGDDVSADRAVSAEIKIEATAPLPDGPFDVIAADPPWRYDFAPSKKTAIERHYPTMPLEEIQALPVAESAAKCS